MPLNSARFKPVPPPLPPEPKAGARRRARAPRHPALLKTGALQNAILNSSNCASIATDEHGLIQVFNVGAEGMLGRAAAEVLNRMTLADLCDPQDLAQRSEALQREPGGTLASGFEALVFKASRGIEDIGELNFLRKDGSRLNTIATMTALRDSAGVIIGFLFVGTDNTARKRLDVALQELNQQLNGARIAAERANLAKSDFLSSMSHELRSPLNAILGFAQLMDSGQPPPTAAQKDSIDQILQAGWYLLELINEVLDLSLIESGKVSLSMEPVSLAEVLADCQAMIEPQARSGGIRVAFHLPEEALSVRADRTRLKQIFVNLLSNAIKYNRVGGSVEVSCGAAAGGRLRISFQDTGEGLSAEKRAHLFEPFNRLGQETGVEQGTGIGLVVCKRLVGLMGGAIDVDSTVGVGSLFWVELGCADAVTMPPPMAAASPALPATALGLRRHTLLCVEDNAANLKLVTQLMARRPDIHLLSARDGRRGIELARSALPDVILMDINLPGISGLAALDILAADPATAGIPVVALSANAMPRDVEKGLQAGFFRYLTKPIKVDEFMHTLDLALEAAHATAGPAA